MITPQELADRMKADILKDVRTGVVPATVANFSQLHDYVDANCYGGTEAMLEEMDVVSDQTDHAHHDNLMKMVDLCNPAMDLVNAWIKDGGVFKGIAQAKLGNTKINVYRRSDDSEAVACLGEECPTGDGWFVRASAELSGKSDPHMQLHMMGRDMLIYSMYHAREPQYLGMAVEHFGAAAKKLGYSLPLKEDEAPWLIYEHGDMDAGAPAEYQFLLEQIASVFGTKAAQVQADALEVKWSSRLATRPDKGRGL